MASTCTNGRRSISLSVLLLAGACIAPQPAKGEVTIASVKAIMTDTRVTGPVANEEVLFAFFEPDVTPLGSESERLAASGLPHREVWPTLPLGQDVEVSPDDCIAWFDEHLLGAVRGEWPETGLAHRTDSRWRIVDDNPAFVIPKGLRGLAGELAAAAVAERFFPHFDPQVARLNADTEQPFTAPKFRVPGGPCGPAGADRRGPTTQPDITTLAVLGRGFQRPGQPQFAPD